MFVEKKMFEKVFYNFSKLIGRFYIQFKAFSWLNFYMFCSYGIILQNPQIYSF